VILDNGAMSDEMMVAFQVCQDAQPVSNLTKPSGLMPFSISGLGRLLPYAVSLGRCSSAVRLRDQRWPLAKYNMRSFFRFIGWPGCINLALGHVTRHAAAAATSRVTIFCGLCDLRARRGCLHHCCDARGMPKVLMRDKADFVDRPT
jgi:hypothetical protein